MNMDHISTTNGRLLNVNSSQSLINSPSVSTFLPEEEASTCPLLPSCTPSPPPPMGFIHPLTQNANNEIGECDGIVGGVSNGGIDDDGSTGSSSGIGMDVPVAGTTTLFHNNVYQHLGKNIESGQNDSVKELEILNIQINKDVPQFVYWNWPVIRKCSLFFFLSIVIAMIGIVITLIVTMPKLCNPPTVWYKGSVFYEIFPTSFRDSNHDGLGDFRGIIEKMSYIKKLGVDGIRLNTIFPSTHYPDHFEEVSTIFEIDEVLGKPSDLLFLIQSLHKNNISIILDLPIYPLYQKLDDINFLDNDGIINKFNLTTSSSSSSSSIINSSNNFDTIGGGGGVGGIRRELQQHKIFSISQAIQYWLSFGIDGFYIKGLEHFYNDPNLLKNIQKWKHLLGDNRILIVDKILFDHLTDDRLTMDIIKSIDLIDVFIDVTNGTRFIAEQINNTIHDYRFRPINNDNLYIHWSLGGLARKRLANQIGPATELNTSLSLTLMELLLPGTPNIFYGDEISLNQVHDIFGDHESLKSKHHLASMPWNNVPQEPNRILPWLPKGAAIEPYFEYISNMIMLRKRSPSIYRNVIVKSDSVESNTLIRCTSDTDIIIVERRFPRRNTFVAISNFNNGRITLDLTKYFYSGEMMIGNTNAGKIYFSEFTVGPMETIIVKLDK